MPNAGGALIELSVLAAALVVAGLLTLLQRRPEPVPEWPPSPTRPPRRRQRVAPVAAGGLLLASVLVVALVSTAAGLELVRPGASAVGGRDANGTVDAIREDVASQTTAPTPEATDELPSGPKRDDARASDRDLRPRPSSGRQHQAS